MSSLSVLKTRDRVSFPFTYPNSAQFVRGMIRNIHPMSTEEIHSRFGAVMPNGMSVHDTRKLLDSFFDQGQLEFSGALWSLV